MSDYPEREMATAGKHGAGNGSTILYKVEARSAYPDPQTFGGFTFDHHWREYHFAEAPHGFGVPSRAPFDPPFTEGFKYEAAEALRWWLHASFNVIGGSCIETRLVAYKLSWSYDTEELGVSTKQEWPRRPWDGFSPRLFT